MNLSRRTFILGAGAGTAGLLLGKASAGHRVTIGVIGIGRQTVHTNLPQFFSMPDVQVVAVCDVDAWRLANAKAQVEAAYARQSASGTFKGCAAYEDFHELLASPGIDAVFVGGPDHWHVQMSMAAVRAGKDVSCEKPITRCIGDGRALADLVKKHGRVFRTDSEFRSLQNFHRAVTLVRNGKIGKLQTIRTGVPGSDVGCPPQPNMAVPPELDYERWQGPAMHAPYTQKRVHTPQSYDRPGWMRHRYYCDGMITNWGAHLNDVAQWGNDTERTGPVEVHAQGTYPPAASFWNVLLNFHAEYLYANGVRLFYKTDEKVYVRFEGSEGWIFAEYLKPLQAEPASVLNATIGDDEIHFPFKSDKQDFIDAVKTRGQTLEDAEVGHRTTSVCHLANIAIQAGKRLNWDPAKERFTNDSAANELVGKWIQAPRAR